MNTDEIPLFPLRTVLFPDGHLPLRIFEQRYLKMVRDCARSDSGFGVCLIVEGEEAIAPVKTAQVGTLAQIVDWYTLEDGLLGVSVLGTRRFRLTLEGLRRNISNARLLVALEPRSNTMRAGIHINDLGPALVAADHVWLKAVDGINWDPQQALAPLQGRGRVVTRTDDLLQQMKDTVRSGDHVVFMSNGGFDAAPRRFCRLLETRKV